MDKKNAEQDIKFIREVLNKTQRDISCKQPLSAASRAAFSGQSGPY